MNAAACAFIVVALLALAACEREQRRFQEASGNAPAQATSPADTVKPGGTVAATTVADPTDPAVASLYQENAYAISQGKQLFTWYNCAGCHAHGGGGMGPPLMDDKWRYGAEPDTIYRTIVDGRPNGMPSFAGRIADTQVWQLVAYVRSMSGLVRADAAPGRADGMQAGEPETRREKTRPRPEPPG
jgi:cytochrome c oxidase cbb3-type subunit III